MHLNVLQPYKSLGTKSALHCVNFAVVGAKFIDIIGLSGAKNSTFLRVMNRLTNANDGRIEVDGVDVLVLAEKAKRDW